MPNQCCTLARFISLVDGNWRNAVFIHSCSKPECHLTEPCHGHLFTTDRDGAPVLVPVEIYQRLTGEQIDPAECHSHIKRTEFEVMYRRTLLWLCDGAKVCGVRRLAAQRFSLPCADRARDEKISP